MKNLVLSNKQQKALDYILQGHNVFLTGNAGTGKSLVIKEAIKRLEANNQNVVVLAPTGIAANNVDGQTIHSFFSIPPFGVKPQPLYVKQEKRDLWSIIDVVIIDEVSMVRPDILDYIETVIKHNKVGHALNKMRFVFVGDMKQLPVVLVGKDKEVLEQYYLDYTFKSSRFYKKLKVKEINLDEVFRQNDQEFIDNLNLVRNNLETLYFDKFIGKKQKGVVLCPTRALAAKHNSKKLEENKNPLVVYNAELKGEIQEKDVIVPFKLELKSNCKVMYLLNKPDEGLVNGSIGEFVIEPNGCFFIKEDIKIKLSKHKFEVKKYELVKNEKGVMKLQLVPVGSCEQYPIMLAYALTIHKSQGLTLDEVTIDLTHKCFEEGQLYVALSRVKTPEGLCIIKN